MTTTAEATAAPISVALGEKTFLISPLRDMDYGLLEKYAQDKYMDLAIRNSEKLESESLKAELIKRAFDTAARVTFTSLEGMRQLTTTGGMIMLVWVSLRKEHPELSIDDVGELLIKAGNAKLLTRAVDKLAKKKKKKKVSGRIPTKRKT